MSSELYSTRKKSDQLIKHIKHENCEIKEGEFNFIKICLFGEREN